MAIRVVPLSFRWPGFQLAETEAANHASCSLASRSRNIEIDATITPELKFSNEGRKHNGGV
jgi:hypothetical protein